MNLEEGESNGNGNDGSSFELLVHFEAAIVAGAGSRVVLDNTRRTK